jgi:hypothetical protein
MYPKFSSGWYPIDIWWKPRTWRLNFTGTRRAPLGSRSTSPHCLVGQFVEDPMDTDEMGVGLSPQTGKPQKTEDLLSGNLT